MKMRTTFFALATALTATAFSQDSLFYANGNVILGRVEEIGLHVVKYRTTSEGREVLIEVDKQELSGVKLKDGQALSFTSTRAGPPYSAAFLGRKQVLTFDIVAPVLNHLTIGYERVLGPHISLMVKAGYIGLWSDSARISEVYGSERGGLITAGVKFILPRSNTPDAPPRDAHPLAGWYLRPEFVFSTWSRATYYSVILPGPYHYYASEEKVTFKYSSAALVLSIGREFFLGEHITFDICGGFGYGERWRERKEDSMNRAYPDEIQEYAFSHVFLSRSSPLVLSGGMRFGYAF